MSTAAYGYLFFEEHLAAIASSLHWHGTTATVVMIHNTIANAHDDTTVDWMEYTALERGFCLSCHLHCAKHL
jgi:hypothetical protein